MHLKNKILLLFALCSLPFAARAQTTNSPPTSLPEDIANGLASMTNWAVAPYGTYAPDSPKKYGGGILLLYNINNYVGAGPGVDWLGEFNLVSANITLRVPLHPFGGLGWTNVTTTPFVIAGIATPLSGAGKANGNVASIEGLGLNVDLFKWKGIQFGAGYAYDNWTGAGPYSGRHHQIFIQVHKGF